jgi:hypothetical protein
MKPFFNFFLNLNLGSRPFPSVNVLKSCGGIFFRRKIIPTEVKTQSNVTYYIKIVFTFDTENNCCISNLISFYRKFVLSFTQNSFCRYVRYLSNTQKDIRLQ